VRSCRLPADLSFLAGRKGFGTAQLNCTSGCKCQVPNFSGHHPHEPVSVFLNMGFLVRRRQQLAAALLPLRQHAVAAAAGLASLSPLPPASPPSSLQATQHPQCRMRVTILDIQKPDPQEGRRFVLGAVMMRPYRL